MKIKYYAVKKGRNIGIFTSWAECENNIKGHSGAVYKSFLTKEEAEKFMKQKIVTKKKAVKPKSKKKTKKKLTKENPHRRVVNSKSGKIYMAIGRE